MADAFFPIPPPADLNDLTASEYCEKEQTSPIIKEEVTTSVTRLAKGKTAGPDEVPAEVLQAGLSVLLDHLLWLFNTSLLLGYYPKHFRKSTTVALKKPGKGDYSLAKLYRPIALLNTTGKVFESILANRLGFLVYQYSMLPKTHLGGQKGTLVETAMHALLTQIHSAWKDKKVLTALFLDVTSAFDNVSHKPLLHNLCKRGVCNHIVSLIQSFIGSRETNLKLLEFTLVGYKIWTGIPQGSPLSPILYLFYNADLLEVTTDTSFDAMSFGYIDDVAITVIGNCGARNIEVLKRLHDRAQVWAHRHSSIFNPTKYQLIHFSQRNCNTLLDLPGLEAPIKAMDLVKYLRIYFDRQLS